MQIPTHIPEPGFYYHYKHDPNGATFPRFRKITDAAVIAQLEEIKNRMYSS